MARIGNKRLKSLMRQQEGDTEMAGGAFSVDTEGKVQIKTKKAPALTLERTNPGAQWKKTIYETTIDFGATGSQVGRAQGGPAISPYSTGAANAATVFTSSFQIPQYTIISGLGVSIKETLSGSLVPGGAGGMNFIDKIGLSQSADNGGVMPTSLGAIRQPQYFMSSSHKIDGTRLILSASGDNAMLFNLPQGFSSASAGTVSAGVRWGSGLVKTQTALYTAITSSNIVLSVTLASASNRTGSMRLALFGETFRPPS